MTPAFQPSPVAIFWFRRDLRLQDNAGLYHALKSVYPVLPLFIFDEKILEKLSSKKDPRVAFIHATLESINATLKEVGSSLVVNYGKPLEVMGQVLAQFSVKAVFANHDYEPYAIARDQEMATFLADRQVEFRTFKDQVIFEKGEIVKENGLPYQVFGAYKKKWVHQLAELYLKPYPTAKYFQKFCKMESLPVPSLASMGFAADPKVNFPLQFVSESIVKKYDQTRDLPSLAGTTRLGLHLRFGTVSVRAMAAKALQLNEVWLGELIWREFFMMILYHFPHVVNRPFHLEYENIPWLNDKKQFEKWCEGNTGYPLVDAGMRELNATGFMHNRVRMVAASFLVKHLLIDYKWGEAYFAEKLLDFDLSANNGNWQWCAGTGCDAAPYFRVFNPSAQALRFDKQQEYIKKWVPEVGTPAYCEPIIDHGFARDRVLKTYKQALIEARGY